MYTYIDGSDSRIMLRLVFIQLITHSQIEIRYVYLYTIQYYLKYGISNIHIYIFI